MFNPPTVLTIPPGGTLHKFGQGCSFEDIFGLPPKNNRLQISIPQKITAVLVPKTNVIFVLQLR